MTEREITLLKRATDLAIATLGQAITSIEDVAKRKKARETIGEYLELSEKINELKPKK